MSKLILTGLCAAAALGLAACGRSEENNMAVENAEEMAPVDNMMADENMADMNNMSDMNMDNAVEDNATGNEALNNSQ